MPDEKVFELAAGDNIEIIPDVPNKKITISAVLTKLDDKVDKVPGKQLSTEDYTTEEKQKLSGIETGAQKNPAKATGSSDGLMSAADKSKLDGIADGAQVNDVNSVAGKTGDVTLEKADVGLNSVDNTSDANKPVSAATQAALDSKVDKAAGKQLSTEDYTSAEKTKLADIETGAQVNAVTSVAEKTGKVILCKSDVDLGNVDNTSDADKPISTAQQTALSNKVDKAAGMGLSSNDFTSAEKTKLAGISSGASADTAATVKTKYESNANTNAFTDAEKAKLAGLESSHFKGQYSTLAALNAVKGELGDYAYVDEGAGKDVVMYSWDTHDNKWIDQKGLTTTETPASVKSKYESNPDTNAYTDAEKSKLSGIEPEAQKNAVTSVAGKNGAVTLTKSDVGLGNADNTSDANKPISTAQQTALNNKVDKVAGKGLSTEDYTAAEKTKLTNIEAGAQKNPGAATTAAAGLMSASDKSKLDGIATGATAGAALSTTAPSAQAFGDKAAVGTGTTAARADHKHAMPAAPTNVSGNAGTATKLATARSLKTNLGSTAAVTFDGSAAQDAIPVTGTLGVGNGGTSRTDGYALNVVVPIQAADPKKIFANPTPDQWGFRHVGFAVTAGDVEDYKTPLYVLYGITGSQWYNVLTFGTATRMTQIAIQAYNGTNQNRIFIRSRHVDNADYTQWQAWQEVTAVNFNRPVTGMLPVANGGTGVSTIAALKTTLGIGNESLTAPTEKVQALGNVTGARAIDCALGNIVTLTATGKITFTLTANAPAGQTRVLTMIITNGGGKTLTWPASVDWGGTAPTLNSTGVNILTFITVDNGSSWLGMVSR